MRTRRCKGDPLAEFDKLPPELRAWVSNAALPWRPGSVRAAYEKAFAKTGNARHALEELDRIESRLVAKDASHIWMGQHPATQVSI